MNIENFKNKIINIHGEKGKLWLKELPAITRHFQKEWLLTDIEPFNNLSYNFVAKCRIKNKYVVLKIGIQSIELLTEVEALKIFDGNGCVKIINSNLEKGAFLIEYISPGKSLIGINDKKAVSIASQVMKNLWKPEPQNHSLIYLSDWAKGFQRLKNKFDGKTIPFPEKIIDKAEKTYHELIESTKQNVVLHGDLHQDNILENGDSWIAIDPKGIIGDPAFEVVSFLNNCLDDAPQQLIKNRIDQFAEELSFDKQRIYDWYFAQSVLSEIWNWEDKLEFDPNLTQACLFRN